MDFELSIDLIMASLPDSFAQFVLDYMMNYIISTTLDLINLLKITEGKLGDKKAKKLPRKRLASIVVKLAIGRGTTRPTWGPRKRWHVMLHLL